MANDRTFRAAWMVYRNHRGEVERRHIQPHVLFYGSSPWHPEDQWLFEAWDIGRGVGRTFAMAGVLAWATTEDGLPPLPAESPERGGEGTRFESMLGAGGVVTLERQPDGQWHLTLPAALAWKEAAGTTFALPATLSAYTARFLAGRLCGGLEHVGVVTWREAATGVRVYP